ncbi:hypothetical protein GYMLUDRAFT_239091, partial [Collybiopsis luxurians FD-317 M1]
HAKDDTEHPVDGTFKVINNHGTIHFGVSAEVDGEYQIIYNSPTAIPGSASFTPVNEVRVWFGLQQKTSTMFLDIAGKYIDVNFEGTKTAKVSYDGPNNNPSWKLV